MDDTIRRTATIERELDGCVVPWCYTTYEEEYAALRNRAAAFDLRPAGRLAVAKDVAVADLDRALARSVEYLLPERSIMSLIIDERGDAIDVLTVHLTADGHLIECAPGRAGRVRAALAAAGVAVEDRTDALATLAVEGPDAGEVFEDLLDAEVRSMPYQSSFVLDGRGWIVSRTGSTGEYGYKLIVPAGDAAALWEAIVERCPPAGWHVLQAAMTEMRQPVPWAELTGDRTVDAARLNWLVDLDQGDFVGRPAIEAQRLEPPVEEVIGFVGRGTEPLEPGAALDVEGCPVGRVIVTASNPLAGTTCGIGSIRRELAAVGIDLTIGGRSFRTASSPYVIPRSWGISAEWDGLDDGDGAG